MDDRPEWFDALADRFRFVREIGHGGMARVYLVEDLRHHRNVALKVLREELAQAVAQDRFLEEIRVAARLNHPNIVPLYDSGIVPAAGPRSALPWFTMMFIDGESLKERLTRGPLPVGEAVDVARAVAAALDYAHGERVIHRDIKPGNILLAGEVPAVADFGIARALDRSGAVDTLTAPGLAVGTAQYMSPEQAGAEASLDLHTDIYSLGCVVYEMLAGHPPFTGPSAQAIIARHHLDSPPPLATVRPTVPPAAVAAVERALAKQPEDRWPSAGAFANALRETTEHPVATAPAAPWRRRWWARRRVRWAAAASAAVAIPVLWHFLGPARQPPLDPDRYMVVQAAVSGPMSSAATMVQQALERWEGAGIVTMIPGRGARNLEAAGLGAVDAREALPRARRTGAGRLVAPALQADGDSLLLRLELWDTGRTARLASTQGRVAAGLGDAAWPRIAALVDELVIGQFGKPRACSWPRAPASLPAVRSLRRGDSLMAEWRLAAAIGAFADASTRDQDLSPASLCGALLQSWTETDRLAWSGPLVRLAGGSSNLTDRDQGILAALRARQSADMAGACALWRSLTGRYPEDFVVHYGLADCLAKDDAVLRDRRSRTGRRFRAEYGEARAALERAAWLNPDVYRSLAPGAGAAARLLLSVTPSQLRLGRALAPDTGGFNARRTLEGDTLAYVPIPTLAIATGAPSASAPPGSEAAASIRLRDLLYRHIAAWREVRPREPEALAVLAEALEMRGDATALDSLRLARTLGPDPAVSHHLATAEVFLLLRIGAPSNPGLLREARRLADSLLRADSTPAGTAYDRAALAALRGRIRDAVHEWRDPELTRRLEVPPYLKEIAPSLQVYAAMGGPVDSIRGLESQVNARIERRFANTDPTDERLRWLALPAPIAWPQFTFATLPLLRGAGDPYVDAVAAAVAGDPNGVRRSLQPYWERRAQGRQVVTLDGLRVEAELRWFAGEADRAIELLDDTLGSLFGLGPGGLQDPLQAAGLIRAAALRAEYAAARGDTVLARQWAGVVNLFWSDAEPTSRVVVRRALDLATQAIP